MKLNESMRRVAEAIRYLIERDKRNVLECTGEKLVLTDEDYMVYFEDFKVAVASEELFKILFSYVIHDETPKRNIQCA